MKLLERWGRGEGVIMTSRKMVSKRYIAMVVTAQRNREFT